VPIRLGSTVIQGTRAAEARRASLPWPSPPNEFRMIKPAEKTSHLEHVKDRRSQADGDRLMTESLRRRDHPEESRDVWTAGPSPRRKA
jgi:hypothetical protein